VAPEESRTGTLEVWLSSNYVDRITVHGITPEPQGVEVAGDRVIFQFTARNPRQHVVIHVHYEVDQFGSLSGQVGTGDLSLGFSQFVYP
jgi:hypothetical protein